MNEDHRISPFSNDAFIEKSIEKKHGLIKDATRENIDKYNFKIQFHEDTWVLKSEGGGFGGHYNIRATKLVNVPFGVLFVEKDKKTQYSQIHVWSDGCIDGDNCFLINVPNGLFKQIHETGGLDEANNPSQ